MTKEKFDSEDKADRRVTAELKKKIARKKTARMFSCQECKRCWWEKVQTTDGVSECNECHTAYNPIPKEKEWGFGRFKCQCGNTFTGFGEMNVTQSKCYTCQKMVAIFEMLQPRRNRQKKAVKKHSCNGTNCFAKQNPISLSIKDNVKTPTCVHPKSGKKILTYSTVHKKTK